MSYLGRTAAPENGPAKGVADGAAKGVENGAADGLADGAVEPVSNRVKNGWNTLLRTVKFRHSTYGRIHVTSRCWQVRMARSMG